MEATLSSFQGNLAAISTEIQSLQDQVCAVARTISPAHATQSQSMSVKLKNRKELHVKLAEFVDGLAISPELIDGIMHTPVSEAYVPFLKDLDKKLQYMVQPHVANSTAVHDVRGDIELLLGKAAGKIREFILSKILACRKPMANIQVDTPS